MHAAALDRSCFSWKAGLLSVCSPGETKGFCSMQQRCGRRRRGCMQGCARKGARTDEHDGRRELVGDAEQLAHQLGPVAQVLLDELAADDAQEGGRRAVRNRLGQQRLARAGLAVQDHALPRMRMYTSAFTRGAAQLAVIIAFMQLAEASSAAEERAKSTLPLLVQLLPWQLPAPSPCLTAAGATGARDN